MAFEKQCWFLFLLLTLFPEISCLRWSSGPDQQVVLHACAGTTLSLPWGFIVNQGESIDTVRWYFSGGSDEMIAIYTFGNFYPTPTFSARTHKTTNAGIDIDHVTALESGNYSVEVVVRDSHGGFLTLSTFVIVSIDDGLQTTDGQLHVVQDPVAEYSNQTGQYHVALRCGTFTYPSNPPFSATWQTPTGQQVASPSYANGRFSLVLPNPVEGGSYVCSIPPALACIHSGSGQAVLTVDTFEARLAVLEAQQRHLEARNGELQHENSLMKVSLSSLQTEVNTLQAENSGLNTKVNTLQTENNSLNTKVNNLQTGVNTLQTDNSNLKVQVSSLQTGVSSLQTIDTALRHRMDTVEGMLSKRVSFHAKLNSDLHVTNGNVVIFPSVINNEGNGYHATSGRFTAPFAGTYCFVASTSISGAGDNIQWQLVLSPDVILDKVSIHPIIMPDTGRSGMGSLNAVVHVNAYQTVWIECYLDCWMWEPATEFSGFLVSADP